MKEISPPVEPVGLDGIWSAMIDPSDRMRALVSCARSIDRRAA
jgi:hypothetical protein